MELLQALQASEKKGTVLSTFKRTALFVALFSWPPSCSELETEPRQSASAPVWKPSFGSSPPAPERYPAPSEALQLCLTFELRRRQVPKDICLVLWKPQKFEIICQYNNSSSFLQLLNSQCSCKAAVCITCLCEARLLKVRFP